MAKFTPNAEQRAEKAVRVHDAALVEAMADTVAARREVMKSDEGCRGTRSQRAAMLEAAALVEKAQELGYSTLAAYSLLSQGEGRAMEREAIANGATGSGDIGRGEIRIKSDKSQGNKMARQRRRIGREAEQPASFWYKENAGEAQEAYTKADAADTGEWFG